MMNSRFIESQRAWKNIPDKHKPTQSCINEDNYPNKNMPCFQKNMKQKSQPKKAPIQRYFSEKGFKKYMPNDYLSNANEITGKGEQQYFNSINSPMIVPHKAPLILEKPERTSGNGKNLMKDKNKIQILNIKSANLKETSSTQSAETLNITRQVPEYVKNKILKNQSSLHPRVSTPRSCLSRENFKIIAKLGEGKFGKVFLVKDLHTGFILAMKIVQKKKIMRDNLLDQFIRQLRIQSFLNHPNIISLYGFFTDQTYFYSLMQVGCDGQLFSVISNNKKLTEQTTSFIIKNLLQAINYIHENKVLHRDIKPENIVLIMGNVKICDFGWAVNKMHSGDMRNTFCGTPLYLSPEIIQGSLYNEKVDLWAIGVLAFQLYLGLTPFNITETCDLYKIVTQQIRFPSEKLISSQFKQFIYAILSKNPNQRLSSNALLNMDFIRKYQDFETCEELCK